jgi:hypothetical protein
MQSGQILPEDAKKNKQSGQTLVEFALLLLVIATISFGFIAITNRNLAKYWVAYARLIVDDPAENANINL